MRGLFITLEGGDGAGKSLQAKMLNEYLTEKGHNIILTREPGGTSISEKIREIIIDKDNNEMFSITEMFLYAASRAQHVEELIKPALLNDSIVICDRFLDSSLVYQGIARGIGVETVDIVNSYAVGGLKPDITFFFDISPKEALNRKKQSAELDRLESEALSFHDKVYMGYKAVAEKYSERIFVLDATDTPENISRIIKNKIDELLDNISMA